MYVLNIVYMYLSNLGHKLNMLKEGPKDACSHMVQLNYMNYPLQNFFYDIPVHKRTV